MAVATCCRSISEQFLAAIMVNKKLFSGLLVILGAAAVAASYVVVWFVVASTMLLICGIPDAPPVPYFTTMEGLIAWPVLAWEVVTSVNWFRCTNDYRMTGSCMHSFPPPYFIMRSNLFITIYCYDRTNGHEVAEAD